jgi:transposase
VTPSTEFCVNLLIARYALGLPFSRVIAMLSFQGLDVAPGTLAGVARRLEGLLAPLAAAIAARNAAAGHAHADETSWRVFGQPADSGGSRWWLWVFTAADTVVCKIAPSRSLKVLDGHYGLAAGQLPEGRGPLVLSSDFYSVYQSFSEAPPGHSLIYGTSSAAPWAPDLGQGLLRGRVRGPGHSWMPS